ncbi:MAG TPA: hypothetical protein PLB51_00855 [Candidatus Paceibacterota bacterium]|nr:hypothetical protein [Candidatus Paceibacterota bacterium]
MGWGNWFRDPTGPGEVKEKVEKHQDGSRTSHTLRTEDNAKVGSRNDHSHVIVHERSDGTKSAHGHGIRGGSKK